PLFPQTRVSRQPGSEPDPPLGRASPPAGQGQALSLRMDAAQSALLLIRGWPDTLWPGQIHRHTLLRVHQWAQAAKTHLTSKVDNWRWDDQSGHWPPALVDQTPEYML